MDNDAFIQALELELSDFSIDYHRKIFARMADLYNAARPIDFVTLTDELESRDELAPVGRHAYNRVAD